MVNPHPPNFDPVYCPPPNSCHAASSFLTPHVGHNCCISPCAVPAQPISFGHMPDTWLGSSPQHPRPSLAFSAGNPAKKPEISQAKTCEHLKSLVKTCKSFMSHHEPIHSHTGLGWSLRPRFEQLVDWSLSCCDFSSYGSQY